ncbi:minor capsid protein, partial [bacterium]|nr:minor capsid protein [bacterium]
MADNEQRDSAEKPQASISFFVKNEAASQAMARRKVEDRGNDEHEAVTMSWNWRDTWQEEHKRAFVVAKMAKADLLTEVHASLQKAIDEGLSFEQWKKEIVPKLEGKWLGKTIGQLWDELSDEEKAKHEPPSAEEREKVIAPKRLETIFRTNMAVANAAGHYKQLMDTRTIYPYWRYVTRADPRVRDAHKPLHNKVFKWDDPFWETFFPPNGFRCRCHVSPMTKRQVERDPKLRIEESNITEGEDGRKILDLGGRYYRNDPGWDYNPGSGVEHLISQAKSNAKGRPPRVQADLEADLARKEAEEEAQRKAKEDAEKAAAEARVRAQRIDDARTQYSKSIKPTLDKAKQIQSDQHTLSRSLEIHPYTRITQAKVDKLIKDQKPSEKLLRTHEAILQLDTTAEAKKLAGENERIASKGNLTKDDIAAIQRNANRIKRLERIQNGLNSRLSNAQEAIELYPETEANAIADTIFNAAGGKNDDKERTVDEKRDEIAQNCDLERVIADQERQI